MPITEVYQGTLEKNPLLDIVAVLHSNDGSAKIIQGVNTGPVRATFETGRYFTAGEEKVCLSSQIGCDMGCVFCVTGKKFEYLPNNPVAKLRDLEPDEIVAQVENALLVIPPSHSDKLVFSFMGMGEPFANIKGVKTAIDDLGKRYPHALATISTIGHSIKGIKTLAEEVASGKHPIPIRLHVSIHGSTDEGRKAIVPYARPLDETLDAAEYYSVATQLPVKLNYVLVSGQNSSPEDAHRLGILLQGRQGLIMKISKLNSADGQGVVSEAEADRFETILSSYGVPTYRFSSMGRDIKAGCGELAKGKRIETVLVKVVSPNRRILSLRRGGTANDYEDMWSIISGKVNHGEHIGAAVEREVWEETGIDLRNSVSQLRRLSTFIYEDDSRPGYRWIVHPVEIMLPQEVPVQIDGAENNEHAWLLEEELLARNIAHPLREELAFFNSQ